jgi:hypothetical protein
MSKRSLVRVPKMLVVKMRRFDIPCAWMVGILVSNNGRQL